MFGDVAGCAPISNRLRLEMTWTEPMSEGLP